MSNTVNVLLVSFRGSAPSSEKKRALLVPTPSITTLTTSAYFGAPVLRCSPQASASFSWSFSLPSHLFPGLHRAFGWTSQTHNNTTPGQPTIGIAHFIALRLAHAADSSFTANAILSARTHTGGVSTLSPGESGARSLTAAS